MYNKTEMNIRFYLNAYFKPVEKICNLFQELRKSIKDMEMATSESQSRPDVISYCLANPRFLDRWQNIFKLGDQHMRDARLNCQDLFLSKNW